MYTQIVLSSSDSAEKFTSSQIGKHIHTYIFLLYSVGVGLVSLGFYKTFLWAFGYVVWGQKQAGAWKS